MGGSEGGGGWWEDGAAFAIRVYTRGLRDMWRNRRNVIHYKNLIIETLPTLERNLTLRRKCRHDFENESRATVTPLNVKLSLT